MLMTGEKRFHIINGADNLAKYGIFCKPVLEDGETGEQYILALDLMDLLNALHDENKELNEFMENTINTLQASFNACAKVRQIAGSNVYEQSVIFSQEKMLKTICENIGLTVDKEQIQTAHEGGSK